ncbi:MAG: DNA translocase FtsK [Tannerella sp.]|nr:DNA translocase FtsK [Tannerella sp.]
MVKHFSTSERVHFITGLLLCFFTVYVGIALLSFFFTGADDQSVVNNMKASDLILKKTAVSNWAGVRGAYISDLTVNEWFGISSFFLLFLLGSVGFKMMKLCKIHIFKRLILCILLTVWSSVLLAFISSGFNGSIFFHPGGLHGDYISEWLINNIGITGLILVLLVVFVLIAILLSNKIIPMMQSKMSIGNIIKNKPPVKEKDDFETEEEEEDESEDEDIEDEDNDEYEEKGEDEEKDDDFGTVKSNSDDNGGFFVEIAKGGEEDNTYDLSELGAYDPRLDLSGYKFPDINLLKKYENSDRQVDMEEQNENQKRIKKTLEDFGINIVSIKATVGPTITLYEVVPDKGVRIAKIRSLEDDIALSLSALGIRIIAPMPGKGTIGIEVPNKNPQIVSMESVISSRKFVESKYELPIVLGRTITNDIFMFDLTKMPHLLVAGATGQGKSVGLNAIITSLLYKKHPSELKFVLVDPKMVEFNIYEDIERHYLAKLPEQDNAIITDFTHVIDTLKSLCKEMDNRYDLLMKAHVRNISEYNDKFINRRLNPEKGHKFMPYIVVVIDEFGDLIMTAGKEIEMPIARIAQKARAVGIHMIIATQRPTTNIITGTIKANFPARTAFKVSSMIDSRTILDSPGANKLVGRGDLLFSQGSEMIRVQCALVGTDEIENIVRTIGDQLGFESAYRLPEVFEEGQSGSSNSIDLSSKDPLFEDAARLIVVHQQGSTSLIQRKFAIGYNRAGRLMDQLEAAGIVGAIEGSKGRQVLIMDEYSLEQKLNTIQG